jgi:MFS family permease
MSVCTWDNCFRQTKEVHGKELRNYLRLVTIAWGFGAACFGAIGGTALPELSKILGAPQFFFGLLGAAPFLAAIPQLPVSWLVERTGKRKWLFIEYCAAHRLLFLLIGAIPFVLPSSWHTVRLGALVTVYCGSFFLSGVAGPTWNGWMSDLIPNRIRGRYWAFRRRVGLVTQMLAALAAGWFIDYSEGTRLGMAGGIGVVFAAAAVFGTIDVLTFVFIPEIPKRISQIKTTWGDLIRSPLADRSFRQLMTYWFLLNFTNAGIIGTFFQRNLREVVQMRNSWVNFVLVVSPCIGWYAAVKWWGCARDRWGNRPILVLASAAIVINPLIWCVIRPDWAWIGLLVPLWGGAVWAGIDMALSSAVLSFGDGGKSSSYVAVQAIISGIGGIAGPLVAGLIGQFLGDWQIQIGSFTFVSYHLLFVLGAGMQALTVPLALRIEEPRARSTREVLRHLYGNVTAVTQALTYIPRRVAGLPMPAGGRGYRDAEPDAMPAMTVSGNTTSAARWNQGGGMVYGRPRNGQNGRIHNGVYPNSYNDYLVQLIELAGKELAEHSRGQEAARTAVAGS